VGIPAELMRPSCDSDELTDRAAAGQMDLMADYAVPLPVTVIADLLGVPHADQDKFRRWSQAIVLGSRWRWPGWP
jgi:cytochrome P450